MADATTATTPKIEELRARLKADSKSRHFYPLAEELRKIRQLEEAEQILRDGIQNHPTYLSAWISLGRVLRDRLRDHEAVEVLKRALSLDGGNVVAAKLLAQAYLGAGDKVEAIKKFKLVYALMPSDEEVEREIERLDRELNPDKYPEVAAVAVAPEPDAPGPPVEAPFGLSSDRNASSSGAQFGIVPEPSRFDSTDPDPFVMEDEPFGSTADATLSRLLEPSRSEAMEFPPPEAVPDTAVLSAPEPALFDGGAGEPEAEPFGDTAETEQAREEEPLSVGSGFDGAEPDEEVAASAAPIPATMTMAQLYESQGHDEQAAKLYRQILEEHPDNDDARNALTRAESGSAPVAAAAPVSKNERIRRLEMWRTRVARS